MPDKNKRIFTIANNLVPYITTGGGNALILNTTKQQKPPFMEDFSMPSQGVKS